ncbi:MAG: YdcF family protein [Deltaproteobacteria bacterium]|nr:YdcF family protein [Deltaproteobacteria bacterium]
MRFCVAALLLAGCGVGIRTPVPAGPASDARFGLLAGRGPDPSPRALCDDWPEAVGDRDSTALSHVSYPESSPSLSCFTPVEHGETVRAGPTPPGCGYPDPRGLGAMISLAARLEGDRPGSLLACSLGRAARLAALAHNARTLRATIARARRSGATYPYAAIVVPGYGTASQGETTIADWLPGRRCRPGRPGDMEALGPIADRATRAAAALRAGVAPVVVVTGGPAHSRLVEAFAMLHVLSCFLPVRPDEVILEPCAEHTHENLRNAGRWLVAMGARAGYVITDDGLQDDYLQDSTGWEWLGGSIDQRSLRDWRFIIGSWRQASTGISAGFWFSPYRFWAEPRRGLGSVTCLR